MKKVLTSSSLKQTMACAAELARELQPGDFVAMEGDLGAGKTQFVRGLVAALGGDPHAVSSPTFVLLNIYPTARLKVFHLDAYRLSSVEDMETIGFSELLEQGGVVVVEWWQKIEALVPHRRWTVLLETLSTRRRRITISQSEPAST